MAPHPLAEPAAGIADVHFHPAEKRSSASSQPSPSRLFETNSRAIFGPRLGPKCPILVPRELVVAFVRAPQRVATTARRLHFGELAPQRGEPAASPFVATPMKKPGAKKRRASEELERNTGFEPATFALARRTDRVTNGRCSSPTFPNPWKSFGAPGTAGGPGSPTIPDGPQRFCSTGVPRRSPTPRRRSSRRAPGMDEGSGPCLVRARRADALQGPSERLSDPLLRRRCRCGWACQERTISWRSASGGAS